MRFHKAYSLQFHLRSFIYRMPFEQKMLWQLRAAWDHTVGPVIAQHTAVARFAQGELWVHVDDNIWLAELTLLRDEIHRALLESIPEEKRRERFQSLRFRLSDLKDRGYPLPSPTLKQIVHPSSTNLDIADQALHGVDNPELREALRRYLAQSLDQTGDPTGSHRTP